MCNLSLELRRLKEKGNGNLEALVQVLPVEHIAGDYF